MVPLNFVLVTHFKLLPPFVEMRLGIVVSVFGYYSIIFLPLILFLNNRIYTGDMYRKLFTMSL